MPSLAIVSPVFLAWYSHCRARRFQPSLSSSAVLRCGDRQAEEESGSRVPTGDDDNVASAVPEHRAAGDGFSTLLKALHRHDLERHGDIEAQVRVGAERPDHALQPAD